MNKAKQIAVGPKAILDAIPRKQRKLAVAELIELMVRARSRISHADRWCANAMFLNLHGRRCGLGTAARSDAIGALYRAGAISAAGPVFVGRERISIAEKLLNEFAAGLYGDMADCAGYSEMKPPITNANDIFGHGAAVRIYGECVLMLQGYAEGL